MPDFQFRTPDTDHPNFVKSNEAWQAIARNELALDEMPDDVVIENGPGAGPWRRIEGKEAFLAFVMDFVPFFQGTWHQDGRCIYADDTVAIALVHETGTAPSGDVFDNRAIWVSRFDADGRTSRIWTTDVDHEAMEQFWQRNPLPAAPG